MCGQDEPPRRRPPFREMLTIYLFIALWEILTMPRTSHSDSWRGVSVSLLALPASVFWLAKPSHFFIIFGAAGSLLFVLRFLNMDCFSLWIAYQAPSTAVIVTCWVFFTLGMGVVCWFAATLRMEQDG